MKSHTLRVAFLLTAKQSAHDDFSSGAVLCYKLTYLPGRLPSLPDRR